MHGSGSNSRHRRADLRAHCTKKLDRKAAKHRSHCPTVRLSDCNCMQPTADFAEGKDLLVPSSMLSFIVPCRLQTARFSKSSAAGHQAPPKRQRHLAVAKFRLDCREGCRAHATRLERYLKERAVEKCIS